MGTEFEFGASGGVITSTGKVLTADDEYTRDQRRAVDARLAAAGKGPYHGPFDSADDAIKFLKKEIRARRAAKPKRSRK